MDENFVEAIVHRRAPLLARLRGYSGHVILGQRLRPLSVWHWELLHGIESPFLKTWKKQPTSTELFNALYLATQICRLKPLQTLAAAPSPYSVLRRKWLVFRFYFRLGLRRPGTRLLRLLIEAAKFRAYMADYCSSPIPFPNKHSKPVQTPVNLYQLELYRRFHPNIATVSDRRLWALSPGEVGWANTAAREAHDYEISIMTEARQKARKEAIRKGKLATERAKNKKMETARPRAVRPEGRPPPTNGDGHARR